MDGSLEKNQKTSQETLSDKVIFEWKSSPSEKKSVGWYVGVIIVAILISGFSVWQKDWFPIIIAVIVTAIVLWYGYSSSVLEKEEHYALTPLGIKIDDRFIPYSDMHSFWASLNQNEGRLFIILNKKYLPAVDIDVSNADPVLIKNFLAKKIPEDTERSENVFMKIQRRLKL